MSRIKIYLTRFSLHLACDVFSFTAYLGILPCYFNCATYLILNRWQHLLPPVLAPLPIKAPHNLVLKLVQPRTEADIWLLYLFFLFL